MVKKLLILLSLTLSILIVGCGKTDSDNPEIIKKVKQVAVEYIHEEEGRTLVPDKVEFTTAVGGGSCWVTGHYKDKPSEKVTVAISYDKGGKNPEVEYTGTPSPDD
ncbi:hypothetical protein [Bacillus massilinigeriensis]|uniref:hypothetical protein n=1 Tax=Bacillus mediterraneensis TaxID=1805474 RepID=UPI00114D45BF|nr:hypothetical protein [Bacillus mediterraneensis]